MRNAFLLSINCPTTESLLGPDWDMILSKSMALPIVERYSGKGLGSHGVRDTPRERSESPLFSPLSNSPFFSPLESLKRVLLATRQSKHCGVGTVRYKIFPVYYVGQTHAQNFLASKSIATGNGTLLQNGAVRAGLPWVPGLTACLRLLVLKLVVSVSWRVVNRPWQRSTCIWSSQDLQIHPLQYGGRRNYS